MESAEIVALEARLSEVCGSCKHQRRHHMGHGRPGSYDTCIAAHGEGGSSVCPCMGFVAADV